MEESSIKTSRGTNFLVVFIILTSVFVTYACYYKYFIKRDFSLYAKEACDPKTEKCFVHQCDDGDPRCSTYPDGKFNYKIILQKEYKAPQCTDGICPEISCSLGDASCQVYMCSDENLSKFELDDSCSS